MPLLLEVGGARRRTEVERSLRDAVRSGRLRFGTKLPSSRILAAQLGVARGVVVEAYAQLAAEGYLGTRPGSGTYVSYAPEANPKISEPTPPVVGPRWDLRSGLPDISAFPRDAWLRATKRALQEMSMLDIGSASAQGLPRLREALGDYARRVRVVAASPERVVVTAGLADALLLLFRTLRRRGATRVAIEDPAWKNHEQTVVAAGLEAVPIPVDEHGLVVAALEQISVDAVVVTPAHQYPTGVAMTPERRTALVTWARRCNALIVEDDYDAEYRYDREAVPALQGLAPDRVVYAATVSKILSPGLRIAWLVVPEFLVGDVVESARVNRAGPSSLEQGTLAILVETGALERHVRTTRALYRGRRDALVAALARKLPRARVGGIAAGLHLVAWLWDDLDDLEVTARARARGIAVHALHARCAVTNGWPSALLLGYACTLEHLIDPAVDELARVLAPPS